LDLALKCERLFAKGTAIYGGTVDPTLKNDVVGDSVVEPPRQSVLSTRKEKDDMNSGIFVDFRVQKDIKGNERLSPTVAALAKIAYPRRIKGSHSTMEDTTYFRLVDIEGYVWTGAVVDKVLLIYFDKSLADKKMELKAGLVAVLDLATDSLNCEHAVICLDRQLMDLPTIIRSFYWVGFDLIKVPSGKLLSDAWIAMEMNL